MPSLLDLSAQELIAKGIAPIKKEHLLPYVSKASASKTADHLEAAGAVAAAAATVAGERISTQPATAATADGSNGAAAAVGDKVVAKKSKRQIRKELKFEKSKTAGLCNNFIHGRCQYGDKCKYRHDAAEYLASKEPDLPGRCPFSLLDACPYGITCRWAGSHKQQEQQQQKVASSSLLNGPADDAAANTTAAPIDPAAASKGAVPSSNGTTAAAPAAAAELQPVADLPSVQSIEPPLNGLPKSLQQQLWKGTYDFSKSDAVLESLGLFTAAARKASWQQQQQQRGKGGKGQQRQQQQQKREQQKREQQNGVTAATHQQAAKKQKLDVGAAAAAVLAAADAADMLLDGLYSAEEATTANSGGVVTTVSAVPANTAAAAAAAGPLAADSLEGPLRAAPAGVVAVAADMATEALDSLHDAIDPGTSAAAAVPATVVAVAADMATEALDSLHDAIVPGTSAAAAVPATVVAVAADMATEALDSLHDAIDPGTSAAAAVPATVVAVAVAIEPTEALDCLYGAIDHAAAAAAEPPLSVAPKVAAPPAAAAAAPNPDASLIASTQAEQHHHQQQQQQQRRVGAAVDASLEPRANCKLDIAGKTYLAPLTTVGNLPFRRLCVGLGCEVTCGEMALATNLLQGQNSEWALLKRHPSEKMFGVQVCGGYPDTMAQLAQVVNEHVNCDFVDINCGCPIDVICNRGAGSALLTRPKQLERVVRATTGCLDKPVIVKIRKGYYDDSDIAHTLIPQMKGWGAAACTLHGRSRQQRYSRAADWDYIKHCASIAHKSGLPLVGNGDVFSPMEWNSRLEASVTTAMIGRAALIKPWIFTEIKEQRLWDISASERLDLLKTYVSHGLEHWGSDSRGVENTRRFLLEWLSFTHRYIPVGLLEVVPQKMSWRPPAYLARNQLDALMASEAASDWVKISEMLLGPAPAGFTFAPKHKSNAYTVSADVMQQMAAAVASEVQQQTAGDDEQENG